jgi:hypothetical protein
MLSARCQARRGDSAWKVSNPWAPKRRLVLSGCRRRIVPMLRRTQAVETVDYARRSLLGGWPSLHMRYGSPAKTPITLYGTLEVRL